MKRLEDRILEGFWDNRFLVIAAALSWQLLFLPCALLFSVGLMASFFGVTYHFTWEALLGATFLLAVLRSATGR